MQDFTFVSPTRFILRRNAESLAGQEAKVFSQNVLIVHYGEGFVVSSGLLARVTASLEAESVTWRQLGGVVPNPVLSLVYKGIALCKAERIGCVIAIGGGSVIDTAKAIALGALYEGDVWDFYTGRAAARAALPIGVVMTTPSTGSEGSCGSVITNETTAEKRDVMGDCIRPAFTLINPELAVGVPKEHLTYGIIDMFSHVTERYFSNLQGDALSNRLCEAVMKTVVDCSCTVLTEQADYDVLANLLWASILAHNGLLGAGRNQDWATHEMGAPLSVTYNAAHGATIAVLLPVWARYVCGENPSLFGRFAEQVFELAPEADAEQTARKGLDALEGWIRGLGLPTHLRDIGVTDRDHFIQMAKAASLGGTIGAVRALNTDDIVRIYTMAF
ncbi:MAG: iron-containing alcohol dehydrogenase [Clostridiales bacterium]|nr:iron-containing alcohol dehydrogenase [Clostridiales bacterium]